MKSNKAYIRHKSSDKAKKCLKNNVNDNAKTLQKLDLDQGWATLFVSRSTLTTQLVYAGYIKMLGGPHLARGPDVAQA
jgi:hypothetical protein